MKPDQTSAQVRANLATLKERDPARGSFVALSKMIRRPPGYLARFVREGMPEWLRDDERALLAAYFRVDEQDLGLRR